MRIGLPKSEKGKTKQRKNMVFHCTNVKCHYKKEMVYETNGNKEMVVDTIKSVNFNVYLNRLNSCRKKGIFPVFPLNTFYFADCITNDEV